MEQDRLAILLLDPKQTHAQQDEAGAMYFEGFAVTEQMTPDKLIFPLSGLRNLADYQRNPVVLWQHDWQQPIGHAELVEARGDGLFVRDRLAPTELVRNTVWPLVQAGSIRGLSIGFRAHKVDFDEETQVTTFSEWSLHEHSLVSLPNNPGALGAAVQAMARGMGYTVASGLEEQGATAVSHPIHEDQSRAWDSGAAERRIKAWAGGNEPNWRKYRSCFCWFDSAKADQFGSYKFPIADIFDGSPQVIWRAVAAAMQRLGSADIPAGDKAGVRRILVKYYKLFDKQPPGQSELGEPLWLADEKTISEINLFGEKLARLCGAAQGAHDIAQHWQGAELDPVAWQLLREDDLARLQEARDHLDAVLRFGETRSPEEAGSDEAGQGDPPDELLNALLEADEERMIDRLLA